MRARRVLARLGTVLVTMGMIGLWAAASASAHVTVTAPGVAAGASDATITFRVPDESDKASTVGLKVQLPTDHPIAGVLVAPQPGWTAQVKQMKLSTPIKTTTARSARSCPRSTGRRPSVPASGPDSSASSPSSAASCRRCQLADLQSGAELQRRHPGGVDRATCPGSNAEAEHPRRPDASRSCRYDRKPVVQRTVGERHRHYAGIVEFRGEQDGCHDRNHPRRRRCRSRRRSLSTHHRPRPPHRPRMTANLQAYMDDRPVRPG